MPAGINDERGELREVNFHRLLPWTELFRAFQLALDPSKLLLATAGVFLLWFGWWFLGLVFQMQTTNPAADNYNIYGVWPASADRGPNPYLAVTEKRHSDLFS